MRIGSTMVASFVTSLLAVGAALAAETKPFDLPLEESTIMQLQAAMSAGRLTSRQLAEHFLHRIEAVDGELNSIIEVNPDALAIADELDAERRAGRTRARCTAFRCCSRTTSIPPTRC